MLTKMNRIRPKLVWAIIVLLVVLTACVSSYAWADKPVSGSTTIKFKVDDGKFDSELPGTDGNRYLAIIEDGNQTAYCLEAGADEPKESEPYQFIGYVSKAVATILDLGYPNDITIHGLVNSRSEAHEATQIAVWVKSKMGPVPDAWNIDFYGPATTAKQKRIKAAAEWLVAQPVKTNATMYAYYGPKNHASMQKLVVAVPVPQSYMGLFLTKKDADTQTPLAGAVFQVRWYDGQYSTIAAAEASGAPDYTWYMRTDNAGQILWDKVHQTGGSALYLNRSGQPAIPVGTVLIKETEAPVGYVLNDEVIVRQIKGTVSGAETVNTYNVPIVTNKKLAGGVKIQKVDADWARFHKKNGSKVDIIFPGVQGNGSMANAEFTIYNENGSVVATLITDDKGQAATPEGVLPFGSYVLKETKAPLGYKVNPVFAKGVSFEIKSVGYVCFDGLTGFLGLESL